ncbi:hypothetical protein PINS_up016261 [Pythium insidiosum]|nr:hypothetical protein PINS_up016261 [Pythium insidiosum]
MGDLLLGRPVMQRLGYDRKDLSDQARRYRDEYDMDQGADKFDLSNGYVQRPLSAESAALMAVSAPSWTDRHAPEEVQFEPDEEEACFPSDFDGTDQSAEVWEILLEKIAEAERNGCSSATSVALKRLLHKYQDVFRIRLGRDPPVSMPPMEVTLKPGAVPV